MRSLLSLLLVALLGGCGAQKVDYVVPDSPDVEACVSLCRQTRTQCLAQVNDRYRQCKADYDYRMQRYNYCLRQGGSFCVMPPDCPRTGSEQCKSTYDGCFLGCGGEIRRSDES